MPLLLKPHPTYVLAFVLLRSTALTRMIMSQGPLESVLPDSDSASTASPLDQGPLRMLAALAIGAIVAQTIGQLAVGVLTFPMFDAVRGVAVSPYRLAPADRLEEVVRLMGWDGLFVLLTTAGAACFFIAWLYRARRNLEGAGVAGFSWARGWLVGSWFIPFANLVIPYRIVAEIADASDRRSLWWVPGRTARRGLLAGWWTAWVALSLVQVVDNFTSSVLDEELPTVEQLDAIKTVALAVVVLNMVLVVVAAVLAVLVIRQVTRHQYERATSAPEPQA